MNTKDFDYKFCCMTFVAKQRSNELCGSNGLPLTSNSIKILGRSQYLKSLNHPYLCSYIDVMRGKHERTIIVSERIGIPLSKKRCKNWKECLYLCENILEALAYLHKKGIVHRHLCKENIYFANNSWKLFNYGLYYMTGNGADVLFPIGSPKYTAPDVILQGPQHSSSYKSDIWSLGVILAEEILGCDLWPNIPLKECLNKVLSFIDCNNVFMKIAEECGKIDVYKKLPSEILTLIQPMLSTNSGFRPNAQDLLKNDIFKIFGCEQKDLNSRQNLAFSGYINLNKEAMVELYHYWQLAGGDVYNELKKNGLIRNKAPVLSIPNLLLLEGTAFGQMKDQANFLDQSVIELSTKHLLDRFRKLPKCIMNPVENQGSVKKEFSEVMSLPLIIRERDTKYQFVRLQLFRQLLKNCPEQRDMVIKEARQDIPPLVRAEVWGQLLAVEKDYEYHYASIDKETPVPTDRQIEVDIPRCHQYNELLSSSVGHQKFKRILKAWVKSHPHYVYWQGLDSLCAPFLYLNFQNEAHAYASLRKFINKYLHNFFLKDNSAVIREYLAKLKHLLAFQDPALASHLHTIGFNPELFAIPWFLTMFSHVFPIHKILHLWDSLLLGDASYPLYIGLSILQQLRTVLLESGFNECILLFSDLPEIDIERCVKDSIFFYCGTPGSVTFRQHDLQNCSLNNSSGMDGIPISLKDLQNEFSPRISAKELNKLILKPALRSKILIVDIRDHTLYKRRSVVGSINIPFSLLDIGNKNGKKTDFNINSKSELNLLQSHKGKIIVVMGDDNMAIASEFCQYLVTLGFGKVCSLNGGINSLECSDILRC